VAAMIASPQRWQRFLDILFVLVSRDFKGRYRDTFLGMLWPMISPLLFLGTFYFVFKVVLDIGIPRYASFMFVGLIVWSWFQTSLIQGAAMITSHPNLVRQPGFPVATLPAVAVAASFINFAISLPILLVVIVAEGGGVSPAMLVLPWLVLVQFVLTLGITYLLAAMNVHFRDTQYVLPVVLQLGYFAIPIFYDRYHVPARFRGLFDYNPLAVLVAAYRQVLIEGRLPDGAGMAFVSIVSLLVLAIGYLYFQRSRDGFLEDI
jgi:lipopolysaccharide transport system permease protein